ncbi:MAG: tRNA uridine-5-carboxymethylaminomethyl(34) synthesis enzyme MnmG [Gemmatimonadetes bacterium]|nr:tRNA uridine-5-carboxymethylaminomethyl(34) synthesis enzyme MnmG [Gemmatimonadota bacterium]
MEPASVDEFDVIVVGGGHAGVEAAVAATRSGGRRVALVTSSADTIGQMSCNPAIGGIAKGTVAREVDALGGVMGRVTDRAAIQFRMLNRGKGPAVWAPRAQCDRVRYRREMQAILAAWPGLTIVPATVSALSFNRDGSVAGVRTTADTTLRARTVVIATGTFLRGRIFIGTDLQIPGGRAGEPPTSELAQQLEAYGFETARFKTGTPPRIDGRTVDYARTERQDSEIDAFAYRWAHLSPSADRLPQVPCWLTWAEARSKDVVVSNIHRSAMYGGAIGARGPRYCPSIEDKVVRFPDAQRHQVFLEPEGLDTPEMYVNGLSTSLPAEVQLELLRSVPALEQVEMTRPGYAIEYDYYPPTGLFPSLESRLVSGLFFAGQVNGTTGYEEAAAQGLVAGLNAGRRAAEREPITFGRESSYIGVLVDDLVTRGVDEPYRLFTSRSEFRLTVRQDNALRRLGPLGIALDLYSNEERAAVDRRIADEDALLTRAGDCSISPDDADPVLVASGSTPLTHAVRVAELARRTGVALGDLLDAAQLARPADDESLVSVELELKYSGYFARERANAERMRSLGAFALPLDAPYATMKSLSTEARHKLVERRPVSLAQAATIPGVSPSDLQNLVLEIERVR